MSKNQQRNLAEIHLGNETFDRGYQDGLRGAAKNIKKTHRHAHRYHIGHRKGMAERGRINAEAVPMTPIRAPRLHETTLTAKEYLNLHFPPKPTFWQRLKAWFRG